MVEIDLGFAQQGLIYFDSILWTVNPVSLCGDVPDKYMWIWVDA